MTNLTHTQGYQRIKTLRNLMQQKLKHWEQYSPSPSDVINAITTWNEEAGKLKNHKELSVPSVFNAQKSLQEAYQKRGKNSDEARELAHKAYKSLCAIEDETRVDKPLSSSERRQAQEIYGKRAVYETVKSALEIKLDGIKKSLLSFKSMPANQRIPVKSLLQTKADVDQVISFREQDDDIKNLLTNVSHKLYVASNVGYKSSIKEVLFDEAIAAVAQAINAVRNNEKPYDYKADLDSRGVTEMSDLVRSINRNLAEKPFYSPDELLGKITVSAKKIKDIASIYHDRELNDNANLLFDFAGQAYRLINTLDNVPFDRLDSWSYPPLYDLLENLQDALSKIELYLRHANAKWTHNYAY